MKASTASSTPRSAAPTTAPGATTCPEPSTSAAAAAAERRLPGQLHQRPRFHCFASRSGRPSGAAPSAIGKPTSCCSPLPARPSSSPHERKSRAPAHRPSNPAKPAAPVAADQLQAWFAALDRKLRQDHHLRQRHRVRPALHPHRHASAIRTFFCDPIAPWQKGAIENAIGRLRTTLAPQDKPQHHRRRRPRCIRRRLQQHAPKVPRLQVPSTKSF